MTYLGLSFDAGSSLSDLTPAVALLEVREHLASLAGVLELVEALSSVDILFDRG